MKKILALVLTGAVLASTVVYFMVGANDSQQSTAQPAATQQPTQTQQSTVAQPPAATQQPQPSQGNTDTSAAAKNFIILQVNNPSIFLNNEKKELDPGRDTTPVEKDGRTLVPIRSIIEAIGGTVAWNEADHKTTITARNKKIELTIGNADILVDGEKVKGDAAPEVINDRTMLPARIVMENLGCTVQWNPDGQLIIIGY